MSSRSRRPTNKQRNDSSNGSNNGHGFAIIGDTVGSTLYARRLLANRVTDPIYLINEGVDRTNVDGIEDPSFAADHVKDILHHITTERVHMVQAGDNDNDDEDDTHMGKQEERIIQYYVGAGPLSDFISAYHIPRVGPWFTHSTSTRLAKFFDEFTMKTPLSPEERVIADRLSSIWNIPQTNSIIVKHPAILRSHYTFLQENNDVHTRELFINEYNTINEADNVDTLTETARLTFSPTGGDNIYDISGRNVSLTNVKVVWRTNPYTYLRIATDGGLSPDPLKIPTFYRAVIPIPIGGTGFTGPAGPTGHHDDHHHHDHHHHDHHHHDHSHSSSSGNGNNRNRGNNRNHNDDGHHHHDHDHNHDSGHTGFTGGTGINLTGICPGSDLILTHHTFSLHDVNNPKQSALTWLGQCYTTLEDLSVINPAGSYSDDRHVLLVVEGLCTKNRRRATYNVADREVQVNYNDIVPEHGFLTQFATIVSHIILAHTGVNVHPSHLIADKSVCNSIGSCMDDTTVVDHAMRESPMVSVLQLASGQYGLEIFPPPSHCPH